MSQEDLNKLTMISEMIKLESSNFCRRLEKQIRILSDVSGMSSTSVFRYDLTNPGNFSGGVFYF